ncbi:MAG: SEC-C metal-binding domain-containing protein [Candidatus Methanoperedens sp.]|nr:SEC-C metal-binding domain-containing protein [Candidatus Methanoperedens sp.]
MSSKPGRNDPCPCGSGNKYKRCCLDKKNNEYFELSNKKVPEFKMPQISPLAMMRIEQKMMRNPVEFAKFKKELDKIGRTEEIRDFISKSWNLDKIKIMSTEDIIGKLGCMNIRFDIEDFKEKAQEYISATDLSEDYYYTQDFHAEGLDEDFIFLAIIELWDRIIPEHGNVEMIDNFMQDGYDYLEKKETETAIEKWEKAWNLILTLVPPDIKSVEEADEYIPGMTQSIYNWCQDFEMELHNASVTNDSFFWKRIKFCNVFCRIFPDSDELIIQNFMLAEADSYASIDDFPTADRLFKELVNSYPDNVWGYINWGDIYAFECHKSANFEKAREIYKLALECGDEIEVVKKRLESLNKRLI